VKALGEKPYDIVFMDCQMPVMDGYEASEKIRREGLGKPGLVIIAMTANALKGDREKCIQAGMDDYISKPVTPDSLAEVLDRWTGKLAGKTPETAASRSSFDASRLEEDFDGDTETIREVLSMFLQTSRDNMNDLSAAIRAGEKMRVKILAHTLKGSALNVGAGGFGEAASRLEKLASGDDLSNADVLYDVMQTEFNALVSLLSEMGYGEV
jgi:response regulator RpfG family c-di-GMP phosphodiesterase